MSVRLLDLLALVVTGWVAYGFRFGFESLLEMRPEYVACLFGGVLGAALLMPVGGLYGSWRGSSGLRVAAHAIIAWAVAFAALLIVLWAGHWADGFSRLWLGYWAVGGAGSVSIIRLGIYTALAWARRRGFNARRVLVFGGGDLGARVVQAIQEHEWTGFKLVGVIDDDPSKEGERLGSVKISTYGGEIEDVVQKTGAEEVWIALPLRSEDRVHELLHDLRHSIVNVRLMPDVFGLRLLNHSITEIAGIPTINLTESPISGFNGLAKAIEDRLLAVVILVLISPLLVVLALGVKLSSPGPVFFRQRRVGWNGKQFDMLKLRSMPVDAEAGCGARWATRDDQRATRFGSFLRRTSLDELPQFINVVRGEMSIVGPRPERPVFVEQFKNEIPDYMQKHLVKAGITGWAQVNGWRGNTDLKKRIEYDLYYIEHCSILFDMHIILRTVVNGFVHRNAY